MNAEDKGCEKGLVQKPEDVMECMIYPSSVRTTVLSAANELLYINNTLLLTILVKEQEVEEYIVTFPWGDGPSHLTLPAMALGITCSVLTGTWTVSHESDPDIGDYWRISGGNGEDSVIQIRWEGLTAFCEGITCIRIRAVCDEENISLLPFYQIPVFKGWPALKIDCFAADRGTVEKGHEVTLRWRVQGAQSCVLDPGNIPVRAEGSRSFFLQQEEVFTLRAFCGRRAVSETRRIYVTENKQTI